MHTDSTLRVDKVSQIDARLTRDNTQNATFECDHTLIEECLHMQKSGQEVDMYGVRGYAHQKRCLMGCYGLPWVSHTHPQNSENAFFTLG